MRFAFQPFVSSCRFYRLWLKGQNIRYSRVNFALGLSKSIRYSGDFVIAGFVSIYFTEILPGFQMLFVITGSSLKRGSLKRGSTVHIIITHQLISAGSHWIKQIMCYKIGQWLSEDICHPVWYPWSDFYSNWRKTKKERSHVFIYIFAFDLWDVVKSILDMTTCHHFLQSLYKSNWVNLWTCILLFRSPTIMPCMTAAFFHFQSKRVYLE